MCIKNFDFYRSLTPCVLNRITKGEQPPLLLTPPRRPERLRAYYETKNSISTHEWIIRKRVYYIK